MARCFVTRPIPGRALDRLAAEHDVVVRDEPLPPTEDDLTDALADVEGLLCMLTDPVTGTVLQHAPRLRAISNYAIGSNNIALDEAKRRNIPVGVTPGVLTDATADLAFALLLAAARRVTEAAGDVKDGRWRTWEPAGWLGLELSGATLAIVGPGRIGRAVRKRAEAFGMRTVLVGRHDPLADVLARADVVSLHAPLTAATRHLVDADALRRMKPTAVLVNTARGGLVDTDALNHALRTHEIAAAALDVTDPEPLPADHPLLHRGNALVVPHIGSATRTARARMADLAVDNLLAGLAGEPLPHAAG
jgi:glyoxylate reductase